MLKVTDFLKTARVGECDDPDIRVKSTEIYSNKKPNNTKYHWVYL
jgi:hypothetical protein